MQRLSLFVLISVLALGAFAAPATAETREQRVSYADLDVSSDAGADALLRRVRRAAEHVCGYRSAQRFLRERAEARACVIDSTNRAVVAVGHPVVTARHEQRAYPLIADAGR